MNGILVRLAVTGTILSAVTLVSSCNKDEGPPQDGGTGRLTVRASVGEYSGGGSVLEGENTVTDMLACIFEDGKMTHVYENIPASDYGYEISIDRHSGTLYLLANTAGHLDLNELMSRDISEDEWRRRTIESERGVPVHFFTGSVDLDGNDASVTSIPVSLKRGVSRFDLKFSTAGKASVSRITLENASASAYLFPVEDELSPVAGSRADITREFDVPLSENTPGAMYVYAQSSGGVTVAVDAVIDGRQVTLTKPLPKDMERNRIYTLTVRKDVIDVVLDITVEDWGEGGDVELSPDGGDRLSVNVTETVFPPGAEVSPDGTVIVLPHTPADFVFTVDSDDALEVMPSSAYLLEVSHEDPDGLPSGTAIGNRFRLRKGLYAPGTEENSVTLKFRRAGLSDVYPEDSIRIVLSANPTSLEGLMDFDNSSYSHAFDGYADNEFGVFHLPEGKEISVEFPDGEDPWMKVEKKAGVPGAWRVLGGWRPNDPTADGRRQAATVVIRNAADGSQREEYVVSRRNWGLPVTWLHGVWWCKYNSMGNSRDFNDQILSSADPAAAAGMTVFDYLESVSPEEYRRLWQWAYIGDSGVGMKVAEKDGMPVMDGYAPSGANINRLPADALSPEGYELPAMEEFNRLFDATSTVWMMWNGTHTLAEPWNGHSVVRREQRRKNGVRVGDITVSDLIYIALSSPDYPEHEPLVWYGPGAQWNDAGIEHSGHCNNMLFSVHSPQGEGWYLGGSMAGLYVYKNGAGPKDTRILRFKKSDVEYLY